jgi:hypothetical protein
MRHVAEPTRFQLDFARIDRDAWNEASAASSPRPDRIWIDPRPLIALVDGATISRYGEYPTPGPRNLRSELRRDPDQNTGPITGPLGPGAGGPGLS